MKLKAEDVSILLENSEILNNVTLNIENKEMIMILGLNGAGKSTLLKALAGLIKPSKGLITYNGTDISSISYKERAKLIAYIPQDAESLPQYTVIDFVIMGITPHIGIFEMPSLKHEKQAETALLQFNIEHLRNKYIDCISGGERKIVYLARAMVQNSELMILDEPTANLDYKRQHEFLKQLKNFLYMNNKCVVLSVHDPSLALKYADKIIIIHNRTIYKRVKRKNIDFEYEFIKALNEVYSNNIEMFKIKGYNVLNWKEE